MQSDKANGETSVRAMNRRPKILIVDDEPFNVTVLEQELDDLDYATVSAANGHEALAQVAAESPDLVLLDIMMPIMDGFAVLARLKADPASRDIPVLVISANSDMPSVVKGISLGAEDYLPKPFDPILLQVRIRACLEKKRLRDKEQLYLRGLERELEIGRQIQAGFLPDHPPQPPGWELAARFHSAREVSGDLYDVFQLSDGQNLGLVVADVCDKGVGAALFMTVFRTLIRVISNLDYFMRRPDGTAAIVDRSDAQADSAATLIDTVGLTNKYITHTHGDSSMFVTLFFGILDPTTGGLSYINAGHEPPIVVGPAGVKASLRPTDPAVGLLPDHGFRRREIYLEPGDTLFVFTDGVTEAQSLEQAFFTTERLLGLLASPVTSAADLLDRVETGLRAHIADTDQSDDITMLAVRRAAPNTSKL
jgi:serine phosphatase RsbU (regulator of sigma subunit)